MPSHHAELIRTTPTEPDSKLAGRIGKEEAGKRRVEVPDVVLLAPGVDQTAVVASQ
jgi:hypothetical protein